MNLRPPLGVMPGWLWRELHAAADREAKQTRIGQLQLAIARYELAGRAPKPEWIEERDRLSMDVATADAIAELDRIARKPVVMVPAAASEIDEEDSRGDRQGGA